MDTRRDVTKKQNKLLFFFIQFTQSLFISWCSIYICVNVRVSTAAAAEQFVFLVVLSSCCPFPDLWSVTFSCFFYCNLTKFKNKIIKNDSFLILFSRDIPPQFLFLDQETLNQPCRPTSRKRRSSVRFVWTACQSCQ